MRWTRTLHLRVRSLFRSGQVERELDEELQYHLQHLIDDYVAAGMSRPEARYKALREMGAIEQRKEECRDARGLALVDTLRQDVTYALRGVRRNPVYSVVLVLSLALGIGANTAVYSVLYALLFRSLPVRDAHQLVQFVTYDQGAEQHEGSFSFPLYTELQQAVAPYAEVAALRPANPTRVAIDGGEPETALVEAVSGDYFAALRVSARAGRVLDAGDDEPSGSLVAVLSHATWQRRFAGDPRAVGMTIRIDNRSYAVVGVAAGDFAGLEALPAHGRLDSTQDERAARLVDESGIAGAVHRRSCEATGRVKPCRVDCGDAVRPSRGRAVPGRPCRPDAPVATAPGRRWLFFAGIAAQTAAVDPDGGGRDDPAALLRQCGESVVRTTGEPQTGARDSPLTRSGARSCIPAAGDGGAGPRRAGRRCRPGAGVCRKSLVGVPTAGTHRAAHDLI
jgi:MacB-like periplasmic core domain